MPGPRSLVLTTALLSGALVLAACGSDSGPEAGPTTPAPATTTAGPALPSDVATPTATATATPEPTGTRTVASLEAQVRFSSVTLTNPVQQSAVAAYKKFITDFVVLAGLPKADYAPAVAAVRSDFRAKAFDSARAVIARNEVVLGTYTERVVQVAGDERGMFIGTCIDYSKRSIYTLATGKRSRGVNPGTVPTLATMVKPTGSSTWLLTGYVQSKGVPCG